MTKSNVLLLAVVMQAIACHAALAHSAKSALVPLPSVDDFTRGQDGFGFGLGLGIEYESAYEGSDEFGFEVNPAGAVQWRRGDDIFYWAGEALGWRGLRSYIWLFDVALAFDEGRAESDSKAGHLRGLGDANERATFVMQARRAFDTNWRYWLDGRVIIDDEGSIGIFGVGRRFGDKNDGTGSEVSVVAVYQDKGRANRDFGITPIQSAASGLNRTNLNGGFRSAGLLYTYRNYISPNWQIFSEILYEHYGTEIRRSPISRKNHEAEIGIGLIYLFR